MNELKDLCDRIVADAPPMRDSSVVLATARRSAVRHGRLRLAGVAAAAVVVAAAALTVPLTVHDGRTGPSPAVGAPAEDRAREHEKTMARLLVAAVPAGYTHHAVQPAPSPRPGLLGSEPVVTSWADAGLILSDRNGKGQLGANVWFTDVAEDPCPPGNPTATCVPVTVGDVTVELTTFTDAAGRHIQAVRRFTGGYVRVYAVQAVEHHPNSEGPVVEPGLAELPFTTDQIVALAADPAMLPQR